MQVANAFVREAPRTLGGQRGQRRRVINNDCSRRQSWSERGDDVVDARVIPEHEVHALSTTHSLCWRRRDANTERFERSRFLERAIPDGDAVTALGGCFGEGTTEEPGS